MIDLRYELALTEEYLRPSPYFASALAFDRNLANGGEHPLVKRLKPDADPLIRDAGSLNDMPYGPMH